MIDNTTFYFGTIRKAVVAFGSLFNNIRIIRYNEDETIAQNMKIPLSFIDKQKFLVRIRQNPSGTREERKVELTLPRMGFTITGMGYDASRKVAILSKAKSLVPDQSAMNTQFNPAPYSINFQLYIAARNLEDGLMIVEQILPFFSPDYNLKVNDIPEMNLQHNFNVVLDGVQMEDAAEGNFDERNLVFFTLNFRTLINVYPPVYTAGPIKHVIVNVYPNVPGANVFDKYTADVDPDTAGPTDEYSILEQWQYFNDNE
jgi:hypothetical protein